MLRDKEEYPNRQSTRADFHNYEWVGSYFVTIGAKGKEPFFDIPDLNIIVRQMWDALPSRFPGLKLDQFIIMPNHIHFIVHLPDRVESSTSFSLGSVIGTYKSLVSHHWLAYIASRGPAGTALPGQIWQRNYYDRIIRNQQELENIRRYIDENPSKG
jgi:putative transposase